MRIILACIVLLAAQETPDQKLQDLLEKLKADRIEQRDAASDELVKLGEPALESLRKLEQTDADAEVKARLKEIIGKIERNLKIAKVCRAAKPVTVRVKDVPLGEFARSLSEQSGLKIELFQGIDGKRVTLSAEKAPILKVLDDACAFLEDVDWSMTEGKILLAPGKHVVRPVVYGEGFRMTLKRIVRIEKTDFDKPSSSVILYFAFDWEPGIQPKNVALSEMELATADGGEKLKFKPAATSTHGGMFGGGGRSVYDFDGMTVQVESQSELDGLCFLKEAPVTLKKLTGLKTKAKARFSIGSKPVKVSLGDSDNRSIRLPDLPVSVRVIDRILLIQSTGGRQVAMDTLFDTESIVVCDKDGKEYKCTSREMGGRNLLYLQCEKDISSIPGAELRYNAPDLIDRELEFEWSDLKIRD